MQNDASLTESADSVTDVRKADQELNKTPFIKGTLDRSYISHLFENIAPHLNRAMNYGTEFGGSAADQASKIAANKMQTNRIKQYLLYDTSFIPLFDNFYLTDPISRASITMGKCSAQFKSHNFQV